jgi:hypothetical protein
MIAVMKIREALFEAMLEIAAMSAEAQSVAISSRASPGPRAAKQIPNHTISGDAASKS